MPHLHVRQVERHHLVADQLVDDRLREEDVLGAAVEAPQEQRDLLRVGALAAGGEAAQVGEEHAGCIVIPPGGEVSTQVAQIVGFLREGR